MPHHMENNNVISCHLTELSQSPQHKGKGMEKDKNGKDSFFCFGNTTVLDWGRILPEPAFHSLGTSFYLVRHHII